MQPKEWISRYWPSVLPAAVLALITASLPVDWPPLARVGVAAGVLVIFTGGRVYQDQLQERRGRIRKLYETLIPLAKDLHRFLQTSSSRTRDVSVFQATMALYNVNIQQLVVWYHGVEEAKMALEWWHHFLGKRLDVLAQEQHYTAPVLVDLFKELSLLATAYDRQIEEFRTRWESPALVGPKEVGKTFESGQPPAGSERRSRIHRVCGQRGVPQSWRYRSVLPGITCSDSDRNSAIVSDGGSGEKWGRENIASNDDQIRRMLFDRSQRCPEGADIPFSIGNKGDSFAGHSVRSYPRSADMWPYDRVRSYPRSADMWPYDRVQWAAQH